MRTSEWPLVAFTLLTQVSVGSFLVLGMVHGYALRKKGMAQADRLSDLALLSILPALGLAVLASLLHLGSPLNAPRAAANLSTSWLSREILSVLIFAALAAVFIFFQWRKIGPFALRNGIAWISAVAGVVLVYSMSRVYMLSAQPAWNTPATPVSFFNTTLLLGCLAVGAALVANHELLRRRRADAPYRLLGDSLRGIAVPVCFVMMTSMTVASGQMTPGHRSAEHRGDGAVGNLHSKPRTTDCRLCMLGARQRFNKLHI
jgi:anaerobic dimethyl sulfoxide reductase subunit C (anchor subunit)